MTKRYEGPITLVAENGTEYAATADLRVETDFGTGRWSWGGSIAGIGAELFNVLGSPMKVRLPDGRDGEAFLKLFSVDSARPWADGATGELVGSGPAPFA